MTKKIETAFDLQPDQQNANQATRRSYNDVYESQELCGWGRDIVVDKNGNVIAGHTAHQVYIDRGNDDVIVVPTDGTKMIIHQRLDLDENDDRTRMLAYYDNASTRHSQWNREQIKRDYEEGRDLRRYFTDEELAALITDADHTPPPSAERQHTYMLSVRCANEDELITLSQRLMEEGYDVRTSMKKDG